jgi:hypothetical protein
VYTTTRDKNRILELENKEKSAKKLAKKINWFFKIILL